MNSPGQGNGEPGYAAANSLRPRSVSRDGGDLSMLCTARSSRHVPRRHGGLRRPPVPVLPRHSPPPHTRARQRARRTGRSVR